MFEGGIRLVTLRETEEFGRALGRIASPGDVICLDGELGAGKTTITQAIAKGLEVPEACYVTSPSFSILHEYPGRIPLYHMDFYRLTDCAEVEDLGFEEYFYMSGLTVIEWSQKAAALLPAERLSLFITIGVGDERIIHCTHLTEGWMRKTINILNL
ncbi:MAG: tRNA (adenosine(37)-N6)-threonylcarbamoyltransferase complex ATPase subunit type 1 TsaE [Desulfocapsaceae bacterium]|nr:tRNA (adenosine(37)-N6)-threonylcarbamoyltransferase complex ATPase subunit type 1 TsaE [Desulfocapsaceae bacterium]